MMTFLVICLHFSLKDFFLLHSFSAIAVSYHIQFFASFFSSASLPQVFDDHMAQPEFLYGEFLIDSGAVMK